MEGDFEDLFLDKNKINGDLKLENIGNGILIPSETNSADEERR